MGFDTSNVEPNKEHLATFFETPMLPIKVTKGHQIDNTFNIWDDEMVNSDTGHDACIKPEVLPPELK